MKLKVRKVQRCRKIEQVVFYLFVHVNVPNFYALYIRNYWKKEEWRLYNFYI